MAQVPQCQKRPHRRADYPDSSVKLTEEDTEEIHQLFRRCCDYFVLQDGCPPTASTVSELFNDIPSEKTLHDHAVLGWKGSDGLHAVAAILRDYPSANTWYLGLLIVDAALRRSGLGHHIYSEIENWAAESGAIEIRLAVLDINREGRKFWEREGFTEYRRVGPEKFKTRMHVRVEMVRQLKVS